MRCKTGTTTAASIEATIKALDGSAPPEHDDLRTKRSVSNAPQGYADRPGVCSNRNAPPASMPMHSRQLPPKSTKWLSKRESTASTQSLHLFKSFSTSPRNPICRPRSMPTVKKANAEILEQSELPPQRWASRACTLGHGEVVGVQWHVRFRRACGGPSARVTVGGPS